MLIPFKPKFDIGLAQEDLPEARVSVESGLRFNPVDGSQRFEIPAFFDFNKNWSFGFFVIQADPDTSDPHFIIGSPSGGGGIYIGLSGDAGSVSARMILRASGTNTILFDQTFVSTGGIWPGTFGPKALFIVLTHDISGGDPVIKMSANNIESASATFTTPASYSPAGGKHFIGYDGFAINFAYRGIANNVLILDKVISAAESLFIFQNGGVLPESAHESCVGHWPLTHREAPLIDQFGPGQHGVIDVVEQYNYAKVTPVTANHGELINFTDAELGVPEKKTQSVWKGFYNKNDKFTYGFRFVYSGSNSQIGVTGVNLTGANQLMIWEGIISATNSNNGGLMDICGLRNSGALMDHTFTLRNNSDNLVPLIRFNGGGFTLEFGGLGWNKSEVKRIRIVSYYDFSTAQFNAVAKYCGQDYTDPLAPNGTFTPSPSFTANQWRIGRLQTGQTNDFNITQEYKIASPASGLTNNDLLDILNYDYSAITELIDLEFHSDEGDITDRQGNTVSYLVGDDPAARALGGGAWRELHSNFVAPEPTKALQFDGTSQYLEVPPITTLNQAETLIIAFKKGPQWDLQSQIVLYQTFQTSTQYMRLGKTNGVGNKKITYLSDNARSLAGSVDVEDEWIVVVATTRDRTDSDLFLQLYNNLFKDVRDTTSTPGNTVTAGTTRIGSTGGNFYFSGQMGYCALFSRVLTEKEIFRVQNNTLLRNPSVDMQNGLELLVDFANPFDDTGTLKFPDLSPNNYEIRAIGWPDIATLQGALVDINSLR